MLENANQAIVKAYQNRSFEPIKIKDITVDVGDGTSWTCRIAEILVPIFLLPVIDRAIIAAIVAFRAGRRITAGNLVANLLAPQSLRVGAGNHICHDAQLHALDAQGLSASLKVARFAGNIAVAIAITTAVDVIFDSIEGVVRRQKLREAIKSLIDQRATLKHYAMINKRLKLTLSTVIDSFNHKVSRKIINVAKELGKGVKLEDLTGTRNGKNQAESFRYAKNSWSFYQLQQMIEYKAKLLGVEVAYVEPAYTSKTCSRCGHIGDRNGKSSKCHACGHVDHADSNAGFNIAKRPRIDRSSKKEIWRKGPLIALKLLWREPR